MRSPEEVRVIVYFCSLEPTVSFDGWMIISLPGSLLKVKENPPKRVWVMQKEVNSLEQSKNAPPDLEVMHQSVRLNPEFDLLMIRDIFCVQ